MLSFATNTLRDRNYNSFEKFAKEKRLYHERMKQERKLSLARADYAPRLQRRAE